MSYQSIARAASDAALRQRIAACVAEQGHAGDTLQTGALATADAIQWQVCAEPGWGDAWDSALASGNLAPGSDPAVISDEMILSAVQKHLGG
jgi:hypothetical protein